MANVAHALPKVNSFTIILDFIELRYQILAELEDNDISLVEDWSSFALADVLSIIRPRDYNIPGPGESFLKCHHCYPGIDDASLPDEFECLYVRHKQSFLSSKDLPEFKSITGIVFYKKAVSAPSVKIKDIEQIHLVGLLSTSPSAPDQDTPLILPLNYSPFSGKVYSDAPGATPNKKQRPLRVVPKKKPTAVPSDRHDKPPKVIELKPKLEKKAALERLKLYHIPVAFYNSESFQNLKRGAIELYRIIRTFSKFPENESLYRYNSAGLAQLCELMERRKEELLATCTAKKRAEIEKIRTSIRSVGRYKDMLCKRCLLYQVVTGKCNVKWGRLSYVSKFLVVVSEKQRFKLINDAKRARASKS